MMTSEPKYTFHTFWSQEDEEFVGTCDEFPSLSWLARSPNEALKGILLLVADVVAKDLAESGEAHEA